MRIYSIDFHHNGTLSISCDAGTVRVSNEPYTHILTECSIVLAAMLNNRPTYSAKTIIDETAKPQQVETGTTGPETF